MGTENYINSVRLIVLFEDPFWMGLFERQEEQGNSVAKTIFGSEPSEIEIYQWVSQSYFRLRFCKPQHEDMKPIRSLNPKRRQRLAQKDLNNRNLTAKAHEMLKLAMQQEKQISKKVKSVRKMENQQAKFLQRQEKRKQKHRGH